MPLPTLGGLQGQGSIGGGSLGSQPRPWWQQQQSGGQSGGQQPRPRPQQQQQAQPQQTFAQLQEQGLARPAPPPAQAPQLAGQYAPGQNQSDFNQQLQQRISGSLATPGRYDLPQVQQVRDALTGQLNSEFGAQRQHLEEDLARRGLSASTIGGGYYGDLAGQQAQAMAGLNASLIQNAAGTNAQDLTAAIAGGQNFSNALSNQGLAQYGANLQGTSANNAANMATQQFNQGQYDNASNLALGAAQSSGNLGLQGQQLGENTRQFDIQQALAQQLGLGGLGLQTRAQGLSEQLGLGNLGLQQQQFGEGQRQFDLQQSLAQQLGLGNLAEQQAGREQQGSQFSQSQAQQNSQFSRQMQLQQAAQTLDAQVRTGQLTLQQAQQQLAELQNTQQFGLQTSAQTAQQQQFADQLAQQLGLATMSDRTANRQIDSQAAATQNENWYRIAQLLSSLGLNTGSTTTRQIAAPPPGGGTYNAPPNPYDPQEQDVET